MFTIQMCQHFPEDHPQLSQICLSSGWADRYGDNLLTSAPPSRLPHIRQYLSQPGAFDKSEEVLIREQLDRDA